MSENNDDDDDKEVSTFERRDPDDDTDVDCGVEVEVPGSVKIFMVWMSLSVVTITGVLLSISESLKRIADKLQG